MSVPASIRFHNPGALWNGPSATKFGSTTYTELNDGQGNHIAAFPDSVHGAAAQFDLLNRVYVGMRIEDALEKWGGGNGLDSYVEDVNRLTGLSGSDRLTAAYLRSPKTGVRFAKAMAWHEAGRDYPMSDADWYKAHQMVFGQVPMVESGLRPRTLGERILARALTHLGEAEIPGPGSNQHILEWFAVLGRSDVHDDETPWCAGFAGAMCVLEGAQVPPPDQALWARAYLNVGLPVEIDEVVPGDLAIWPRGQNAGHINIVESVDHENGTVTCIGGNQGDKVSRAAPRRMSEALGFRCPVPSKLRPNGTKSFSNTVKDSPSLRMHFTGLFSAIGAGIAYAWDSIEKGVDYVFGVLPTASDHVNRIVDSSTSIAQHAGIPLTAKILFGLTVATLVTVLVRGWLQRRGIDTPLANTLPGAQEA